MRSFFYSSYYFWVVVRAIIILLGIISILGLAAMDGGFNTLEILVNFSFMVYLVLMVILFINEVRTAEQNRVVKIITGIYSVLAGVGIIIAIGIAGGNSLAGIGVIFSLSLVLLGIFDLLFIKKITSRDQ